MTKHIIFNSGGIGSWAALKRVLANNRREDVVNLFTDTLIEDRDLYRFLIESTAEACGIPQPSALIEMCNNIPDITSDQDVDMRKKVLSNISEEAMRLIPNLVWIIEGRTPWEVFRDTRFLGNSRLAKCSHVLKQEAAAEYVFANFKPNECALYLGIDWTEEHRKAAPVRNWAPYTVKFPMCDEPYVAKHDMLRELDELNIERPRLYEKGFAHNNCGGFCVRAGQGHFANLLKQFPDQFAYHERKEEEMRNFLDKDVTILKKVRDKVTYRLTLRELRESVEDIGACDIDYDDIGGCGCFVQDDRIETELI